LQQNHFGFLRIATEMVFLILALLISNGDLLLLAAYDMRVDGD
jgi:hypothetical protein